MPKRTFHRLDADKQERVLRAAIEEFQASGFDNTLMSAIALRAGIAKGSLYQYFDDKRELFTYCATWSLEQFMAIVDRDTPLRDMDVYDYFLTTTRQRIDGFLAEPLLLAFSADVASGRHGTIAQDAMAAIRAVGDDYELKMIRTGIERGTIRSDLDEVVLLTFMQGVTERFSTQLMAMSDGLRTGLDDAQMARADDLIRQMVSLMKEGMGGKDAPQRGGPGEDLQDGPKRQPSAQRG